MKLISINQDMLDKAWKKQKEALLNSRLGLHDTSVTFNLSDLFIPKEQIEKPTIYITTDSWFRMFALVAGTSEEIGWHGLVENLTPGKYLIHHVQCYPQIVTAATTTTDEEEYTKWNMALSMDEVNNMRFQGHSHVNMGVSPSAIDIEYYNSILKLLPAESFYIFCILNKRDVSTWLLYDLKTNLIYEDKDLDVRIVDDQGVCYKDWATETIDKFITQKAYVYHSETPGLVPTQKNKWPYTSYQKTELNSDVPPATEGKKNKTRKKAQPRNPLTKN